MPEASASEQQKSNATIELLCRIPAGCTAFAGHMPTVPLLVKIILRILDRATDYTAGTLLSPCSDSEQCKRDAVAAGVMTQLLLLVQSDYTEKAKKLCVRIRSSAREMRWRLV